MINQNRRDELIMKPSQLEQDYAYCEGIIKKSSKSFYTAFSKLPEEKAKAVYAIYAFCRRADDTVDAQAPASERAAQLETLTEELELFRTGATPDHPMWRALRDVFDRFPMDFNPFFDQLEGQRRDLSFQPIQTLAELEEYSYYVAGSVGLMLLPILASRQPMSTELRESAASLGIAMQITNILRDVGEDYQHNQRIYLPQEALERHGVDLPTIYHNGPDAAFIRLWEELAQEAEKRYNRFWQYIRLYDEECRFPVLVAAKLYCAIMDSVRKNGYDCLKSRNFVPEKKMVQLIVEVKSLLRG